MINRPYTFCPTRLLMTLVILAVCACLQGEKGTFAETPVKAPTPVLKFAVIADPHYMRNGPDTSWLMFKESPYLLEDALRQINELGGVQFILLTGDVMGNTQTQQWADFYKTVFQQTRIPLYVGLGPQDIGPGGKAATLRAIKQHATRGFTLPNKGYYSFSPTPQARFLVLDSTPDPATNPAPTTNGFISGEQLAWVKKQLEAEKDRMVFIVTHVPVVEPFSSPARRLREPDASKLLGVLEGAPRVTAVLSGHYHAAKRTRRNGIEHIATPALVEYPNAFRVITVYDDGTLEATWHETRLKTVRQWSRERSPWPSEALGDPGQDHAWKTPLRYFPTTR